MPNLRDFVLPEEGHVWVSRDFSSQEMRLLAHFEKGSLCEAFNNDPDLDPHAMVQQLIKAKTGLTITRKHCKNIGFGLIYGMGIPALSRGLDCDTEQARVMVDAYHTALPGVGKLQRITKGRGQNGRPVTTWGGRKYHAEEGRIINGEWRSFEYKLLNYLIQGSAADQTKECINLWYEEKQDEDVFMATVHDEINISTPRDIAQKGNEILERVMAMDKFNVPMRSTVGIGNTWGEACSNS